MVATLHPAGQLVVASIALVGIAIVQP